MRTTHYLGKYCESPFIETRNSYPEFYSVDYNNVKLDNSWVWILGGNFTAVIPILNLNVTLRYSPITDANSSGAELPKAMNVAPATSV